LIRGRDVSGGNLFTLLEVAAGWLRIEAPINLKPERMRRFAGSIPGADYTMDMASLLSRFRRYTLRDNTNFAAHQLGVRLAPTILTDYILGNSRWRPKNRETVEIGGPKRHT